MYTMFKDVVLTRVCVLQLRIGREQHRPESRFDIATLFYHSDIYTSICSQEMMFAFGLFWAIHRGKLTACQSDGKVDSFTQAEINPILKDGRVLILCRALTKLRLGPHTSSACAYVYD